MGELEKNRYERSQLRGAFGRDLRTTLEADLKEVFQTQITQEILIYRESMIMEIERMTRDTTALLQRAERLSWALSTPDVERDMQLKESVEALASPSSSP